MSALLLHIWRKIVSLSVLVEIYFLNPWFIYFPMIYGKLATWLNDWKLVELHIFKLNFVGELRFLLEKIED